MNISSLTDCCVHLASVELKLCTFNYLNFVMIRSRFEDQRVYTVNVGAYLLVIASARPCSIIVLNTETGSVGRQVRYLSKCQKRRSFEV